MGSHRYYQHAEIPHPHPGPPLEGEGDFAWLNNVANQDASCTSSFRVARVAGRGARARGHRTKQGLNEQGAQHSQAEACRERHSK